MGVTNILKEGSKNHMNMAGNGVAIGPLSHHALTRPIPSLPLEIHRLKSLALCTCACA
jgi:hypothetical protein